MNESIWTFFLGPLLKKTQCGCPKPSPFCLDAAARIAKNEAPTGCRTCPTARCPATGSHHPTNRKGRLEGRHLHARHYPSYPVVTRRVFRGSCTERDWEQTRESNLKRAAARNLRSGGQGFCILFLHAHTYLRCPIVRPFEWCLKVHAGVLFGLFSLLSNFYPIIRFTKEKRKTHDAFAKSTMEHLE